MENLTELQIFKGYVRYLIERYLESHIFMIKKLGDNPEIREFFRVIEPWNKSEKDLWDCFEDFKPHYGAAGTCDRCAAEEFVTGGDLEFFKSYLRNVFRCYLINLISEVCPNNIKLEPWKSGKKDFWDCFETIDEFTKEHFEYLKEDHFGDCIGMATTCARCYAEDLFKN